MNLYLKNIIPFLLFTAITYNANCQNKKVCDSLIHLLTTAKHDTDKIRIYNLLAVNYVSTDTSSALKYIRHINELSEKNNYIKGKIIYNHNLGIFHYYQSNYALSIEYYTKALKLKQSIGDKKGLSSAYNNLGLVYAAQANYPKAIENYLKSIKIDEDLGNKKGVSDSYQNVGIIYSLQGNHSSAIDYYMKSIALLNELNSAITHTVSKTDLSASFATCYTNLGLSHYYQQKYSKALEYYQLSLSISKAAGDKKGMLQAFNNIGMLYDEEKNYVKTIEFYQKAQDIIEELGDKASSTVVLGNIAYTKIRQKDYTEAITIAEKSLAIATEINSLDDIRIAYEHLSNAHKGLKNFEKALDYYYKSRQISDSIFNIEKHKQFSEMEGKYQNEKKKKEIELLNKDKELQKTELNRQKLQKYSFIGGFVLMLVLAIIILISYREKKKANILLSEQKKEIEEKNEELNQQNEEIRTQRDEIESQRDMVLQQKDHIEEIHTKLTDSIMYAERIQHAVLPTKIFIESIFKEYFILYKPKDIVSGDFYWIAKRNDWVLLSVADCTGHGVPGAFMSMLGISFLNDIVSKEETNMASMVLDELREHVMLSLQQSGGNIMGEQKDGMDMSFVAINTKTMTLQYAGANLSLYISSNKAKQANDSTIQQIASPEARNDGSELIERSLNVVEVKGDKMPVAVFDNMKPFTNHIFNYNNGDTIYLFSDGYESQIGGVKGKKFLSKKFKQLLEDNAAKPIADQKICLEQNLTEWMHRSDYNHEQTDDITVIGIKL